MKKDIFKVIFKDDPEWAIKEEECKQRTIKSVMALFHNDYSNKPVIEHMAGSYAYMRQEMLFWKNMYMQDVIIKERKERMVKNKEK